METAPSGGAGMGSYADSLDSMSPRSRGGESWEEPLASSAAAQAAAAAAGGNASSKLRLMCSYGGHIVPRPHDKTLCYLGGETRIVVVDRHSALADLHAHLSRTLLAGCPFSLKYQLPSEDLDSLISVTTDEDLDNMVEEYDRITGGSTSSSASSSAATATTRKPSRLRLFLFVAKPESAGPSSSISSLLDDSKSETWFVDALNGAMLNRNLSSADSAASSVNCLLGLDDLNPSSNGTGTGVLQDPHNEMLFPRQDSSVKVAAVAAVGGSRHGGQDVHSVPESPKASSFGSASSVPSLSNLPPIRVRPEDRGPDLRTMGAGLDDHFAHMLVSGEQKHPQHQLDAADGTSHQLQFYPAPPQLNAPVTTALATAGAPNNSPTENPNPSRVFSPDDDRSDSGGLRRSPSQQPKEQQQNTNLMDTPISSDAVSRPVYYQERPFPAADPTKQEGSAGDPSYRLPVHITEQGYLLQQPPPPPQPSMQTVEQLQQHQAQQHFIQANPHLLHHHPSAAGTAGAAIPLTSYYQIPIHSQQQLPKPAHPYNTQVPMYFLPVRQNPPYSIAQPGFAEGATASPISSAAGKPTIPMPSTVLPRVKPELAPASANLYRTVVSAAAAPAAVPPHQPTHLIHLADQSPQYVSYHPMHHHPSQSTAAVPGYSYEYADAVHGQPMYYTAATSAALPAQFQTMNPGAVSADSPPAMQHPTGDPKQTRAL